MDEKAQVLASNARFGQILLNLLMNAAQAIPEDEPPSRHRISIVATQHPESNTLRLQVSDTGEGIAPEGLKAIFTPFYTTKGAGTGLGLPICRRTAQDLGGDIAVSSAVGQGTTVTVTLPLALGSPDVQVQGERRPGYPKRRVLILDDDGAVGTALERLLRPHHFVKVVSSAEEGLAALEVGHLFDAVLCDLMMPGMGAPGFLERLRTIDPGMAARVAIITGGAMSDAARALLDGTLPVLSKPFDLQNILLVVDALTA